MTYLEQDLGTNFLKKSKNENLPNNYREDICKLSCETEGNNLIFARTISQI